MTVRVIHSCTVVCMYVQTMFPNDSTYIELESDDVTLVLKLGLKLVWEPDKMVAQRVPGSDKIISK